MNFSYAFFILSNTELIWRGSHDNMWTILTWNRHSLHSLLLIRVQLRKVMASVRLPTALRKDLQYVDKKHLQWPFRISGISWSIHVIHRDRTMPGCLYFCLYTKLLTTTSDPPNHPKHIVQPKLRTWWHVLGPPTHSPVPWSAGHTARTPGTQAVAVENHIISV